MKIEDSIDQHHKLLAELTHLHKESAKRLQIMENMQAWSIPVYAILGACGVAALLKVFGVF